MHARDDVVTYVVYVQTGDSLTFSATAACCERIQHGIAKRRLVSPEE
jgi:hypothetical protein